MPTGIGGKTDSVSCVSLFETDTIASEAVAEGRGSLIKAVQSYALFRRLANFFRIKMNAAYVCIR